MKSNFSFENKSNFMLMKVSGKFDKKEFLSFPNMMLTKCIENKMSGMLVNTLDVDYSNLSTMDRFYIGEELAKQTRSELKVAIVVPTQHINKFLETVAINRGATVLVVDTVEDARNWLTE